MSEITIVFALDAFQFRFVWEATEAEFTELLRSQRSLVERHGLPLDDYLAQCVVEAPSLLESPDPVAARGCAIGIVAFVMRQETGNAEHPGTIGDYVGAYDVQVTFE